MSWTDATDASAVAQRLVRVHEVLDLCIQRRMQGEALSDQQIIAEHPQLMPELAHELRGLAMIERARRNASSRSRNGRSSSPVSLAGAAAAARSVAQISGYEIVRPVHSGAQGVVYQAVQRSTQRNVAIKVMREAAPDGLREFSRFEREVQILATLRHPNIVAIHDSGLTPDGRAYFVMDFIEGQPLDEWIAALRTGGPEGGAQSPRAGRLAIDAFLDVFATICDAVHAAHLRGVIHRDIKPANIRIDAAGQPHVLDFGLAKTVGQPTDSDMTVAGQFIGSLPWASPEQAEGAIEKTDVRTDVYALGVVLFGGLTGKFPYDVSGPMRDVLERIISSEPRPPSSHLRAAGRPHAVGDDLDTITLKCLRKEQERRYQSARDLAQDIRAYRGGEPIEARRNSAFYLLRKRMGRYRTALVGGVVFALTVSALAAYAAYQAKLSRDRAVAEQAARQVAEQATRQADAARQQASQMFEEASAARQAEQEQRRRSEREAERARSVTDFLVRTLGMADPDVTQVSDLSMHSLLDRTSAEIESAFVDQPASEATVRLVVGRAYAALGDLESALPQLERAYAIRREEDAEDRRELYDVLWAFVQVLDDLGDERWRDGWRVLARTNRKLLAREFPGISLVLERHYNMQNSEAFDAAEECRLRAAIRESFASIAAPGDPRWMLLADWSALFGVNHAFRQRSKPACEMLREALEIQRQILPETNTRVVRTLATLVEMLIEDEQYADAEFLTRDALSKISKSLSADHWYVAALRSRLAGSLIGLGKLDEAETILQDATRRLDSGLADASRHRIHALSYAAWLADARGNAQQADELWRDAARRLAGEFREGNRFDLLRYAVRPAERAELEVLSDLTTSVRARRNVYNRAIDRTIAVQKKLFADDDPRSAVLGDLYYRLARGALATRGIDAPTIRLFEEAERLTRNSTCINPWKRASALFGLGLAHEARREFAAGEECARQALEIVEPQFGEKLGLAAAIRSLQSACIGGQGRYEQAAPLALQAFDQLLDRWGGSFRETRMALERVARLYTAVGRPEDALPAMRRISRDYKVSWNTLRPAFAARYPDLAREIDGLGQVQSRDAQSISVAVSRLLEARRAAFDASSPDAILYENSAYDFVDTHMMVEPAAAWAPLFRDFVEVERAHFDPPRQTTASRLWWCAVSLIEGGHFAEAEPLARESCEITQRFDAAGARAHAGRAIVLARALSGQGRSAEALPILEGALDALADRIDNRNGVQYVAAILDILPAAGRLAAVTETLVPYIERVLAESKDATFLHHLSKRLSACEELDPALRSLAVAVARQATEIRPLDPAHWETLAIAAHRVGDEPAAAAARERAATLRSEPPTP